VYEVSKGKTAKNAAQNAHDAARGIKQDCFLGFANILEDLLPRQLQLLLHEPPDIVNDSAHESGSALLRRVLDFGSHDSGPHCATNHETDRIVRNPCANPLGKPVLGQSCISD
jgi:hypothetical protein